MNMKQLLTTLVALLFCLTTYAQSVPQGMKYQAVARDHQGQILADQEIDLLIELLVEGKDKRNVYTEKHYVVTNSLGLFSLTIGEGEAEKGDFQEIPWSENEVWMQIGMDENKDGRFTTLSSTKLLAVPYAFHAGSAEKLADSEASQRNGGIYWHILGNSGTVPGITFIGTTDFKDFVMKTNNQEAMRITAMGEIEMKGDLDVDGIARFNNTAESTTKDNGSVIVEGGVGIEKNTNIGGNIDVAGTSKFNSQVTINAPITGGVQEDYTQYPLQVEGGDHGVAIKINGVTPDRNANFLTMFDGAGDPMGRIEGFQALTGVARSVIDDLVDNVDDDYDNVDESTTPTANVPSSAAQFFNSDYGFGLLNETFDLVFAAVNFGIQLTACLAGIGIAGDCDDAVAAAIEFGVQFIKLGGYIAYNEINRGVAFESGGADYAEWLQKENVNERLAFGDVVGVKGGLVSKEFTNADRFMVVSQNPTVIGAMPEDSESQMFEKIAFMGQVPVKVVGEVKRGDYILPSGKEDGLAIAVAPEEMKTRDYARIIGISWGESDGEKVYEYVNTAVGLNTNDLTNTVEEMQSLLNEIQIALKQVNPDYEPSFYDVDNQLASNIQQSEAPYNSLEQLAADQMGIVAGETSMEDALAMLNNYAQGHGMNLSDLPYITEVINNPYDQELVQEMTNHYTQVLAKLENMINEMDRG